MNNSRTLADRIEDLLPQTQCTKCGFAGCRPYAEAIADGHANYNQCPPGGVEGVVRLASLLGKPVIPLNPDNGLERPRPLAVIDETLCIGCTLCIQACPVDAIVGAPKQMHTVIEKLCTGCDLCVAPCPVDCIAMVPVTGNHTGWDAWTEQQADAAREHHDQRLARLEREREAAEARAAARHAGAAAHGAAHTAAQVASGATADAEKTASAAVSADATSANTNATAAGVSAATHGTATPTPGTAPSAAPAADAEAKKRAIIQAALDRARRKKDDNAARGTGPRNTDHVSADVQSQIDAAEARRKRLGIASAEAGNVSETQPADASSDDTSKQTGPNGSPTSTGHDTDPPHGE